MLLRTILPNGYIDAHHHVWAPDSLGTLIGYRWLRDIGAMKPFGDPTPIQRDYRMEEFAGESATPPFASVHVQADPALPNPVIETAFVQAEADRTHREIKTIAFADLSAPDLRFTLAAHGRYPSFGGVRQIVARLDDRPDLTFSPRDLLADPAWREGLKPLEDDHLVFELQMYPEQAEQALEALAATPRLKVVIDHALCPYDQSPDGFERWSNAVTLMAERDHAYIKLSGWGMYQRDWTADGGASVRAYVDHIMASFGPSRVIWGSNYPVEKLAQPYDLCVRTIAEMLTPEHRKQVFAANASTAYSFLLPLT